MQADGAIGSSRLFHPDLAKKQSAAGDPSPLVTPSPKKCKIHFRTLADE
jgi:hypothetical protein